MEKIGGWTKLEIVSLYVRVFFILKACKGLLLSEIVTYHERSFNIPWISFQPLEDLSVVHRESYRIVLEKDEDGRVVVRSPDLQGVVTDGVDEKEAIQNAFEAVNAILETRGLPKEYNLTLTRKFSA